jgi:hypothetical protein
MPSRVVTKLRVKRRQQRLVSKNVKRKARTVRTLRKHRKSARKVMRGGLLNATVKSVNIKVEQDVVSEAFTLSFRKSFTNRTNTVVLELVVDINKYEGSVSLLLNALLSELSGTEYELNLGSKLFDHITRKHGISGNSTLLKYTSDTFYDKFKDKICTGIYEDWDNAVNDLYGKSKMRELSQREISIDNIENEIKKMEKTNNSKVNFNISIENGKITIKDVKKSTIFCNSATVTLDWNYGQPAGTAKVGNFCKYVSDEDTEVKSGYITTASNITIDSILSKLNEIQEIHVTKFQEEKRKAEEAAAAIAEQAKKAAKAKADAEEAAANEVKRVAAEKKFDEEFPSESKKELKEAIGNISEFTSWIKDWKEKRNKQPNSYHHSNETIVIQIRSEISKAFLSGYTEEQRTKITESLRLCRQTYQKLSKNEDEIFINYFNTIVSDYVLQYALKKYLELSDYNIKEYSKDNDNELTALWRTVFEYIEPSNID